MTQSLCFVGLALLPNSVFAWEFTPGLPCILSHQSGATEVTLTYDPTQPLYSFSLKQPDPFVPAPVFGLRFTGDLALAIGTDRHQFTEGGTRLTVTDTGFGNVLNGLQFNDVMIAAIGPDLISVPLVGASDAVAAFRACEAAPPVS